MKLKYIRKALQDALDQLEDISDEVEVRLESNTYFVGESKFFLGASGFEGGYLPLDIHKIHNYLEENDDLCPDCGAPVEWDEAGEHCKCTRCKYED